MSTSGNTHTDGNVTISATCSFSVERKGKDAWLVLYDGTEIQLRYFASSSDLLNTTLQQFSSKTQLVMQAIGTPGLHLFAPRGLSTWGGQQCRATSGRAELKLGSGDKKNTLTIVGTLSAVVGPVLSSVVNVPPELNSMAPTLSKFEASLLKNGGKVSSGHRLGSSNDVTTTDGTNAIAKKDGSATVMVENMTIHGKQGMAVSQTGPAIVNIRNSTIKGTFSGSAISFGGGAKVNIENVVVR